MVAMFCSRKSLTPPAPRRSSRVRSAKNALSGPCATVLRQTTDSRFAHGVGTSA